MNHFSVSSLKTFARCPREFHYRYDLGLESLEKGLDLEFGLFTHFYLQTRFAGFDFKDSIGAAQVNTPLSDYWLAIAKVVLEEYENLQDIGAHYQPEVVEGSFELTIGKYRYKGTIDLLANRGGEYVLVDHKTTKSKDLSAFMDYRTFDPQLQLYAYACEHFFKKPVRKMYYNVIRRPLLKQKNIEHFPQFLERIRDNIQSGGYFAEIPVETNDLLQYQAICDLNEYADMIEMGHRPRNAASCRSFGRACDFVPVCSGEVENPELASDLYQVRVRK